MCRDAVKSGIKVVWRCLNCSEITGPLAESSRIEEEMDPLDIPPSFGTCISENQEMGMFVFFTL